MQQKDELFALVQTLEKSERRYFRLFSALAHSTEPTSSVELFEVLCKMKAWNPEHVHAEADRLGWASQLSTVKSRLYNQILKSLRLQLEGKQAETQLLTQLEDLSLLYQRALYPAVKKRLKRLEKQAKLYQLPEIRIKIEAWQRRLHLHFPPKSFKNSIDFSPDSASQQISYETQLSTLHDHIRIHVRYRHNGRKQQEKEINDLLQNPILQTLPDTCSLRGQVLFFNANGLGRLALGKPREALPYYQSLFELWDRHPVWIQTDTDLYLSSFNNYLNCRLFIKQASDWDQVLDTQPPSSLNPAQQFNFERIRNSSTLLRCLYYRDYESVEPKVSRIGEWLKGPGKNIGLAHWLGMAFNISVFYFFNEKMAATNVWLMAILGRKDRYIREDLRTGAQLLQIVVQIHKEEISLAENLIRNAKRRFQEKELQQELSIVESLRRYLFAKNKESRRAALRSLQKHQNSGGKKLAPGVHEISYWAKSTLSNRPIWEVFDEWQAGSV